MNSYKKYMFPLIETIRVKDGKLMHLPYHQHRFEASYYKLYKQLTSLNLEEVIEVPDSYQKGCVKLRFLYNATDCFCQYDYYQPKQISSIKLVEDNTIDYSLKWVNRRALEVLLSQKGKADEILIVKNGRITDTSFTNLVFNDGKHWITPRFPLLHGTARARLLNEKKIITRDIFVEDLKDYKTFKLINAMLDFEKQPALDIRNIN